MYYFKKKEKNKKKNKTKNGKRVTKMLKKDGQALPLRKKKKNKNNRQIDGKQRDTDYVWKVT